nr:immunoglobulin heavy chain junction region [Macaca mulatta]MOW87425.1 immunoglobulin heavy chain junction region [Macaca mulatta]MOW91176.1 immunoglobulin heavy chain junction region [Macaca mulatta]MOW93008.1 immunoglobulin heavy chain junction region [Macaca mulatta]
CATPYYNFWSGYPNFDYW